MLKTIEHQLCKLHCRSYCHLVGNGTAGIALCLQALALNDRHVAIPDSVCINVPLAVSYAGSHAFSLDVSLDDLGMSLEGLKVNLKSLDAVIAVHGYGSICRIKEIETIAAGRGLPVIEDACLAQGGQAGVRPVGSFGIASVVSFGAGKPISIGHGGAILTDDKELYNNIKALDAKLPAYTDAAGRGVDELVKAYKQLYNAHYGRDFEEHICLFRQNALAARRFFLHRFEDRMRSRLTTKLQTLPREIELRWRNWRSLADGLTAHLGGRIYLLTPPPGSVPWRLNILMDHRNEAMSALHRLRLHASSWYPPASSVFQVMGGNCSNSYKLGTHILNLWISDGVEPGYMRATIEVIEQALDQVPVFPL